MDSSHPLYYRPPAAAQPPAEEERIFAIKRAALQLFKDGNGPEFEARVRVVLRDG